MSLTKIIVIVVVTLTIVAAIVWAFIPKPVESDLAAAQRGDIVVTVDEEGETRVRERYTIYAPLNGRLERIDCEAGDKVVKGGRLTRIDPLVPSLLDQRSIVQAEARVKAAQAKTNAAVAKVEQVRASHTLAQKALKRVQDLQATNEISMERFDQAEAEAIGSAQALRSAEFALEGARHELELAQAALLQFQSRPDSDQGDGKGFTITFPMDGRLLRVYRESAGVVVAGEPLVEIGDPTSLEIVVDLLTTDAVKVREGAEVMLVHWGGDTNLHGKVKRVEPSGFTKISALGIEEQRVNVIINPSDEKGWPSLGDGYRVEARIVVAKGQGALLVATSALFRQGDGWAVFTVVDGKAEKRGVKIGLRSPFEVEITEGLAEGEQVILHPSDKIVDGVEVKQR